MWGGGQQGVNLLELMLVLAIAGLLLATGVPALGRLQDEQRLRSQSLALLGSLRFARDEALRRQRPVQVCAANLKRNLQLQGCQPRGRAWDEGALVYADRQSPGNAAYDSGERLQLAMFRPQALAVASADGQVGFATDGRLLAGGPVHFFIVSRQSGRCLELTLASNGRPRLGALRDGCA